MRALAWELSTPEPNKTSHYVDPSCKGIDGNKKVKGRKEHVVVDMLGFPIAVAVHEANLHDRKGAPKVIEILDYKFTPPLSKILADGGYHGTLGYWVSEKVRMDSGNRTTT